jgi:hypothetical protein
MRYRLFDFAIESDIAFDALTPCTDAPRIEVRREDHTWCLEDAAWFHAFSRPDETPWLRIGRTGDALALDFGDGDLLRYQAGIVWWQRARQEGEASFRHRVLDQALPLVAAHEGIVVLHAACVTARGRAVLLAGPAGAGKSTLAAALARDHDAAVGDDAAALAIEGESVLARAGYAAVRLWPDSSAALEYAGGDPVWEGSGKRRFLGRTATASSAALQAIYVLDPRGEAASVRAIEMRGRDAVMALVRHTFVLDPADRARAAGLFDQLCAVVARVAVRRLIVPHRFGLLRRSVSLVGADLSGQVEW